MTTERTFSIIKPDATRRNLTGKVIDRLESAPLDPQEQALLERLRLAVPAR